MTAFLIIIGILFILYGLIVLSVGSGTKFFLVWIVLGLVCGAAAFCTKHDFWRHISPLLRRTLAGLLLLCLLVTAGTSALIIRGFKSKGEPDLDYIVVLGAQVYSTGPSAVLKYRLDAAKDYLQENESARCIVTGGKGYNEPFPEAYGMRDYLVRNGIDEDRIFIEDESANTVQNIRNSMIFFDPEKDRIGIVTNNFHLFRGTSIAKKAGIAHVSGIAAGSTRLYLPNNVLREVLGVIKDKLCGNM